MRSCLSWLIPLVLLVPVQAQSDLSFPQIIVGESFETVVQVSNDVRWGHRTPIEFLMAILCAMALERLARRWRSKALDSGNLSQTPDLASS